MTSPDQTQDDNTQAAGETGALAAASTHDNAAGDPLAPLNALTEDDDQ